MRTIFYVVTVLPDFVLLDAVYKLAAMELEM
jgi:hypothetical protein